MSVTSFLRPSMPLVRGCVRSGLRGLRRAGATVGARALGTAALGAVVVLSSACSSDNGKTSSASTTGANAGATTAANAGSTTPSHEGRTDEPASTFTELTGGKGTYLLTAQAGPDLAKSGYTSREYAAAGSAVRYTAAPAAASSSTTTAPGATTVSDGRIQLVAGESADYRSRVVVRRPEQASKFNGTLVVEWLNVSSGGDAAPDYAYLADELVRRGYAWAGVSAQRIGVEGGAVAVPVDVGMDTGAGKGIKNIDPERYGSLVHPGDAFAYDLFTQVARGLREAAPGSPMEGLKVTTSLAVGESQSAFALTTYVNGVQPLTHEFDGILIHSRGGASMPLGEPGSGVDIASSILGTPTQIRTDQKTPVFVVQTETDVLGALSYYPARQPDNDYLRVWEIAGTAHADHFQIGPAEPMLKCPEPINDGQQVFVMRAALRELAAWAATGTTPPPAKPLAVDTTGPAPRYVTDEAGNVRDGVRTPAVDAPTQVLSGMPAEGGSLACMLMGTTNALSADALAARYATPDAYATAYAKATDAAIDAGFLLRDDRATIIADARPGGVRPS